MQTPPLLPTFSGGGGGSGAPQDVCAASVLGCPPRASQWERTLLPWSELRGGTCTPDTDHPRYATVHNGFIHQPSAFLGIHTVLEQTRQEDRPQGCGAGAAPRGRGRRAQQVILDTGFSFLLFIFFSEKGISPPSPQGYRAAFDKWVDKGRRNHGLVLETCIVLGLPCDQQKRNNLHKLQKMKKQI